MAVQPMDYRWSSHHCNAQGINEARITPHTRYLDLGFCPTERQQIYRALFQDALPTEDTEALRAHTHQQRALGSDRSRAQVEALTRRADTLRPRGRLRAGNK